VISVLVHGIKNYCAIGIPYVLHGNAIARSWFGNVQSWLGGSGIDYEH